MIGLKEIHEDEQLARRVLAVARSFAPCLNRLEGEDRDLAVAVLSGVAAEAEGRGSRLASSERVGSASVWWRDAVWFTSEDKDALRALCDAVTAGTGLAVGHFPRPSKTISRAFEECRDEIY